MTSKQEKVERINKAQILLEMICAMPPVYIDVTLRAKCPFVMMS